MTARRITRTLRATSGTDAEVDQARADVDVARAVVQAVRRRIRAGEDGASALSTAEWKLALALDRLAALGGTPPPSFPSADHDDEPAA